MKAREIVGTSVSGSLFVVGIILLAVLPEWEIWPGILLLIAATSAIDEFIKGKWVDALITLFIMGGLYAWFDGQIDMAAEMAIPFGLIGIGILTMLKVFQRQDKDDNDSTETSPKAKRKNAIHDYDDLVDIDGYEAYETDEFGVIIDDEHYGDTNILERG